MKTQRLVTGEEYRKLETAARQGNVDEFQELLADWMREEAELFPVFFGIAQGILFQVGLERNLCGEMYLRTPEEFGSTEEAIGYLSSFLEGFREKQEERKAVHWAKAYIERHLSEEISMAEVANHLNLNYSYFSRMFRQAAGSSFSGYVCECRMQEARKRLQDGERVRDVAEYVGYREVKSFSRAFRKRFGIAPSRWFLLKEGMAWQRTENGERYAADNRMQKLESNV
ncbi:MAG: AraC family transcriptional regulator [Eubacteriales bacterium]|nr:AraC family transcriptional regulator [Eubacteriales bacterium]